MEELIKEMLDRAKAAQRVVERYSQEQIDDICLSVAWEVYREENIEMLARAAVSETGMGVVADKITKHKNKVLGVVADIKGAKSVGLIEADEKKQIFKYAKPVGVVGALVPVTNPTATPASNAISILKGANAVIFAPHPKAKACTKMAIDFMRAGLKRIGAPEDLVQVICEPSIELTRELMKAVDLVVATGGGAMVKAAYSSGTPAYGVGPGNSVQMIAEDADIKDAIKKIKSSKCFDNATSCSSENSIIVQKDRYDAVLGELKSAGAYVCTAEEKARLQNWMWRPNKEGVVGINPLIIAKSAATIASEAGLNVPEGISMLVVEGDMPVESDPFAREKLSPVLTVWKYGEFLEGYSIMERLTDHCGTGHSCGIHSFNEAYIGYIGEHMRTSRVIVRQPQAAANGGAFFNHMPSTVTLGCGTWGGNITSENITYRHFLNITWLSKPVDIWTPSEEEMFGGLFERYGR